MSDQVTLWEEERWCQFSLLRNLSTSFTVVSWMSYVLYSLVDHSVSKARMVVRDKVFLLTPISSLGTTYKFLINGHLTVKFTFDVHFMPISQTCNTVPVKPSPPLQQSRETMRSFFLLHNEYYQGESNALPGEWNALPGECNALRSEAHETRTRSMTEIINRQSSFSHGLCPTNLVVHLSNVEGAL